MEMLKQKQCEPFYQTTAWKKARAARLEMDHGMCVECMRLYRAGLMRGPRRASMVHHIQPYKDHPELALSLDNLESLCDRHHAEKHPEKARSAEKRTTDRHGMRIIKV